MYIKKLILFVLLVFLFHGCSSSKQESVTIQKCVESVTVKTDVPNWITNPSKENSICSIGSAPIADMKTTRTIALMSAKANISKEIEVYVDTFSSNKTEFTSFSSEQSTNMLKDVKIVDRYEDNLNHIYYLRACITLKKEQKI